MSAWVTVGIPTAAGIATAIYATGGRAALARRVMRQELEVADLLPEGQEKHAMQRAAVDRAAVYVSRRLGQEPLTRKQHAVLVGSMLVGVLFGSNGFMLTRTVSPDTPLLLIAESLASMMMFIGAAVAATALFSWAARWIVASRTTSRRLSVAAHRERLANYDTADQA